MGRRYLFGPVAAFPAENLLQFRAAGDCLTFGASGKADISITSCASWSEFCARLPADWRPEFIALYLAYSGAPEWLWSAPLPLVGLAADWNFLWSHYRHCLRGLELILTDTTGVEKMQQAGIEHARAANLFGLDRAYVDYSWPNGTRDIDVLFVGNMSVVQSERLAWLGRLAQLADRYRVVIRAGVFGDEYRELLSRARIVFNRSIRGECNRRVFEAAAAGALLFQEAENLEVSAYLEEGMEYIAYTSGNLERLLGYYLEHEEERRAIAEAGRARVRSYSFATLWETHLNLIEREWPGMQERLGTRLSAEQCGKTGSEALLRRTTQLLCSTESIDATLVQELTAAVAEQPASASLHNALGLTLASHGESAEAVTVHFRNAFENDRLHVLAGLNAVEALARSGQRQHAMETATVCLATLDQTEPEKLHALDEAHYPTAYDLFRVEWESAGWKNAGDRIAESRAKWELLRWRLYNLLAELTGDAIFVYEACLIRPDLPVTRSLLGTALLSMGRAREAVSHLKFAVEQNPFDCESARKLNEALASANDEAERRRLARERRLLSRSAPKFVPPEAWFMDAPPVGDELASIMILCCNELDVTRLCLESVLRHTRRPFELILVNNGSTDGTRANASHLL